MLPPEKPSLAHCVSLNPLCRVRFKEISAGSSGGGKSFDSKCTPRAFKGWGREKEMLRKARAVIGAGYGDEGKGLMTDYHASQGADVVVRFNGGAQAGHTVQTPDGRRHVFHHVGSAAFLDLPTHLSQFFILNPIFLKTELQDLARLGVRPKLTGDPRALVTTPFDMLINQIAETVRGNARHGSCGLGIGETVERSLRPDLALTFDDLRQGRDFLRNRLLRIREQWIEPRLQALGMANVPESYRQVLPSDGLIERYLEDCQDFLSLVDRRQDGNVSGDVIFEGAQGLLLDQDFGAFPFVTRSNTGLKNIVAFSQEAGIGMVEVTYATRCYTTRHGAGPLAHADADTPWLSMVDPTNAPNAWQGTIRTAPLDIDVLQGAIRHDLRYQSSGVICQGHLSVSCLDQIGPGYAVVHKGRAMALDHGEAASEIGRLSGFDVRYASFGPTRETIRATSSEFASAA